jgi:hypothetical protein
VSDTVTYMYEDEWRSLPLSQQLTYVVGLTTQRDVMLESVVGLFMDDVSQWWRGDAVKFVGRRDLGPMLEWCGPVVKRSSSPPRLRRLVRDVISYARAAHLARNRVVHDLWSVLAGSDGVFVPGVSNYRDSALWERATDPSNQRTIDDLLETDMLLRRAIIMIGSVRELVTDTAMPPGHEGFMVAFNTSVASGDFVIEDDGTLSGLPPESDPR